MSALGELHNLANSRVGSEHLQMREAICLDMIRA